MSATVSAVPPVEFITGKHMAVSLSRTRGTLWERVAESAPDSLGALGQRVRTPSAPGFIATADRRGPRLNGGFKRNWAMTNTYRMCASGIFHTGERVQ